MVANALSITLGSVSIACWVVVFSPQFIENYLRQSGDGLSLGFVIVWLIGDLGNLFGAILAQLLPTVIILAFYYTLCDLGLLVQIYYYQWKNARRRFNVESSETTPLLDSDAEAQKSSQPPVGFLAKWASIQHYVSFSFVFSAGAVVWFMSRDYDFVDEEPGHSESNEWLIQLFGWSSAILYLVARIPQIRKNFKTRSKGLSPALFMWVVSGNATFALSICAASLSSKDPRYWATNASWLAGSGFSLALDSVILGQLVYYRWWCPSLPEKRPVQGGC